MNQPRRAAACQLTYENVKTTSPAISASVSAGSVSATCAGLDPCISTEKTPAPRANF